MTMQAAGGQADVLRRSGSAQSGHGEEFREQWLADIAGGDEGIEFDAFGGRCSVAAGVWPGASTPTDPSKSQSVGCFSNRSYSPANQALYLSATAR